MAEYLRKEHGGLNEVVSDNNNDKDDDDDDDNDNDANSKDVEVVEFGTGEALTMLVNLGQLSNEERNSEQKSKTYQWLFHVRIKFVW